MTVPSSKSRETLYLLDANVIREIKEGGHKNVQAWLRAVPDDSLRISAFTVFELRKGWEALKRRDPARAARGLAGLDTLQEAYGGRIIPVDEPVAAEWARLVGEKGKHRDDMALAATARVHDLVLVTRNVKDFRGRGVKVLNPFKQNPSVVTV